MKVRWHHPLLLIDLSLPRNIDATVPDLDNVTLYNIDDLEAVAQAGLRHPERELAARQEMIDRPVVALIEKVERERQGDENERIRRSSRAYHPFETQKHRVRVAASVRPCYTTELGGMNCVHASLQPAVVVRYRSGRCEE